MGCSVRKTKGKGDRMIGNREQGNIESKIIQCEESIFWNKIIVGCTWDSVSWGNYFLAFLEKFIFLFFWLPNTGNKLVEKLGEQ